MSAVKSSTATLRIYGDDLIPQHITGILGATPTLARIKGEKFVRSKKGRTYVAKSGMWQLGVPDREPEDINGQIKEIFVKISADVSVWQSLNEKYRVNLFCGLFMTETNDGLGISPESLAILAARGIELWFDIYAPIDDDHETST